MFDAAPRAVVSLSTLPDWDRTTWSVTCGWLFGNDHVNAVSAPAPSFVTVTEVPLPAFPAPAGYATERSTMPGRPRAGTTNNPAPCGSRAQHHAWLSQAQLSVFERLASPVSIVTRIRTGAGQTNRPVAPRTREP